MEANQRFVGGLCAFALLVVYYLHVTFVYARACVHEVPAVSDSKGARCCEATHTSVCTWSGGGVGLGEEKQERNLFSSARRTTVHLRAPFWKWRIIKACVHVPACTPQPTLLLIK